MAISQDVITLIAALIGYLGALVPSVIGNRTKQIEALSIIADGRMEWIREIRKHYSEMMTILDLFQGCEESAIPVHYREMFYNARNGLMILFMHTDEQDRYPSDRVIIDFIDGDMNDIRKNRENLTNELRRVIRTEWNKVIETTGKAKDEEITKIQTNHARRVHEENQNDHDEMSH